MANNHIVEVVLAARFLGIRCTMEQFDFYKHYGARIISIRRDGEQLEDLEGYSYKENDTLRLATERGFVDMWADSRVFLIITNGRELEQSSPRWKKWLSLTLLTIMIVGATVGDMFLLGGGGGDYGAMQHLSCQKYTKFISWDILVTIASAFAISRTMALSGLADAIAAVLIGISRSLSPRALLIAIYLTTNIITELITNNAAAAFAFPLLHIDSKWKFRKMITFRDNYARQHNWELIVEYNREAYNQGINPFIHGSKVHTDLMKTQALLTALKRHGFDAAFGGARRDEERSRAKERIFSFRNAYQQ